MLGELKSDFLNSSNVFDSRIYKGITSLLFLQQEHKRNSGLHEREAKVKYTLNARILETYGITTYVVKVSRNHWIDNDSFSGRS